MKKLLIFALPGGALLLLAWWGWKRFASRSADPGVEPRQTRPEPVAALDPARN